MDGAECDAQDVVDALAPLYGGYKLLTLRGVGEALATARETACLTSHPMTWTRRAGWSFASG